MLPLCREEGIGIIPWSPLARGFLAGVRRKADYGDTPRAKGDEFAHQLYYADADFAVAERNAELARRHGRSPAQIAIAWLLAQPGVTSPIVGASKLAHLDEAVQAIDLKLSSEDIAFIEQPYQPHRVLGH
jgi:aryl-alcohol dehydrogenase (NADP+)